MAKVISTLFISADGVAEIDPEWHFPYFDDNMGRAVGEDYETADVLLIGRETYDSFAGAWPGREAAGGDDAPFAKQLGDVRKVVVSRQRLEFSWRNSELISGDLLDAVTSLKADAGIRGILIPGSISVVQQLLAAGLVDELRLLVHPVAARKGRRLFDDGDAPYHLKVTATEAFPTGVIRVIYSPAEVPAKVGYNEVKDQVPGGKSPPSEEDRRNGVTSVGRATAGSGLALGQPVAAVRAEQGRPVPNAVTPPLGRPVSDSAYT